MFDPRQVTVDEVRALISAGYRHQDRERVEAGIARLWNRSNWWRIAMNKPLSLVVHKLARPRR